MKPLKKIAGQEAELEDILQALGTHSAGSTDGILYTVLTGNDGPRWLLPNRKNLLRTVLAEWHPYSAAGRMHWLALRTAATYGVLRLLPGTAQIHLPTTAGRDLLAHIGIQADAPPPAVYVGTPTITRKLVIFLFDPNRANSAAIKLPLTAAARTCLRGEAEFLKKLEGKSFAPRLLHDSPESGAIMQQYLHGIPGSRHCKPAYVRLLLELAQNGDPVSLRNYGQRLGQRLRGQVSYLGHSSKVEAALSYLETNVELPQVIIHGDFAPWNIREFGDGNCAIVDWEWAEWSGLPLYDLAHFFYIQTRSFAPNTLFYPSMIRDKSWQVYCNSLGIAHDMMPRLAAAFLLDLLVRSWEANRGPSAQFCMGQLQRFLDNVKKPP